MGQDVVNMVPNIFDLGGQLDDLKDPTHSWSSLSFELELNYWFLLRHSVDRHTALFRTKDDPGWVRKVADESHFVFVLVLERLNLLLALA